MTLFELLKKKPSGRIISQILNGQIRNYSKSEYIQEIEKYIAILKSQNVGKGDYVILMANTSLEWHFFDLATMAIGAITVPLFPTLSNDDFERMIEHFDAKLLVTDCLESNFKVPTIYLKGQEKNSLVSLYNSIGETEDLFKITQERRPDEVSCLLATSGTTGVPKLAMFTHEQLTSMLTSVHERMIGKVSRDSKSHTILPLAHVLGRCDSLLHFVLPSTTQFATSLEDLALELKITRPSYLVTIPHVLEKIKTAIEEIIAKQGPFHSKALSKAIEISQNYYEDLKNKKDISRYQLTFFHQSQKIIKKALKGTGLENLKFIVLGGSLLSESEFKFFQSIGIPIAQGYGLTETLGPLTITELHQFDHHSVGLPFNNVFIKIAEDGEILVNCPYLTQSYLNLESDAFDKDGFFKTGDIGEVTHQNELAITDRKKDIITTEQGRQVSPQKIENTLKKMKSVENAMVASNSKGQLVALISTHKGLFSEYINSGQISADIRPELYPEDSLMQRVIHDDISRANKVLSGHENIKKFLILPFRLDKDSVFITPSLKLRRELLYNKFKDEINATR